MLFNICFHSDGKKPPRVKLALGCQKMKETILQEAVAVTRKYLSARTIVVFAVWILVAAGLMAMAKFNYDYDFQLSQAYFFAANIEVLLGAMVFFLSILVDVINTMKADQKEFKSQLREEVMDIIGKKVTVKIGGDPPKKNPNEIVGSETVVHVTNEEAAKSGNIIGEKVELKIGQDKKKQD